MNELLLMRLHEAILMIYMISIACYFFDFVLKSKQVKKFGTYLLLCVFGLQTLSIILFIVVTKRFPIETLSEGFFFFTWLIVLISLLSIKYIQTEFLVFLMNIIGFVFMTIHTFQPVQMTSGTKITHMMNELLMIHVTLAISAYVLFLVSAIHSVLYLLQMHYLKKKQFNHKFFRLSDLNAIETRVQWFMMVGFLLLLISLILGIYWGHIIVGRQIWYDYKVLGSILLLGLYGSLIYIHRQSKVKRNIYMEFNITIFLLLLINYLLVSKVSGFHQLFY
ncbi:cytochrome c biogenesis protein CcsA [Macrococcus sp. DPC7161]|uniref:cytochrome c biogenesis protein CcsA n=1 Tax=Macrococcus sp. DPC7161 TaxID=2507060 RepID=UPI00100B4150|nr:cytochrome c biogenesis protein CcsA [Macrococcus sp. DPC7161]RXK18167.1 cytochrome C assembly protein [Macrococcus sp. DPC7161]